MKFEEVIPALREGKKVRRKGWVTDTNYIALDEYSEVRYFQLEPNGKKNEWQSIWSAMPWDSVRFDDWEIIDEGEDA